MSANPPSRVSWVLTAIMLAMFAGAAATLRVIDRMQTELRPQEVLYLPSAKVVRRMSLGYTGLMADLYWTRAVQYFGGKHKYRSTDYQLLAPLLDITTDLDPHLVVAYRFGVIFLSQNPPDGAGEPDKAAALIEKGIKANPDEWQLYYDLGFLQAMERHDYIAAADAFNRGSKVPGAHPFLKILAAAMAQHGGDTETARMLWQTTYDTTEDSMIKQNALKHLRALQVDETVTRLDAAVQAYREKTGRQPASFLELISAGYLRGIPVDPLGHPYRLRPDGKIEVQDPDALPFIRQGLPPGYKPLRQSVPQVGL